MIRKLLYSMTLSILFVMMPQRADAEAFKAGSYIVDWGQQPQTYENGLYPYGLLFDLVIRNEIPVYWIIKPGKQLMGTDFSYNGKDYMGSALVIPAVYVNSDVLATIDYWKNKGVVIDGPTATDFDAPAYNYITSFPNAVVDQQNVKLVTGLFYDHVYIAADDRGIPPSYYITGTPKDITACSDVYALPHADPQDPSKWTSVEQGVYDSYIKNAAGFLWQGCHSVGAVEAHSGATGGTTTLTFTADVTIKVKDKGGFVIDKDFPEIIIDHTVEIFAEKFEMKDNTKITIASGGALIIHTKDGKIKFGKNAAISGSYTLDSNGGKSGSGGDGDLNGAATISSDKEYNKVKLQPAGGGTNANFLNMFILTTNGQIAWEDDPDYTFDNTNTPPFNHESSAGDSPIFQIADYLSHGDSAAQTDGSQKIYIPRPDSQWRSTTTVAVWDPDNVNLSLNGGNPNKAALIAFGRAYGNPNLGMVVQQASHTSQTGSETENVSSARIYGNLLLQAGIEKRPNVSISSPSDLYYPNTYEMTATVTRGTEPFAFTWSMECKGTTNPGIFSDQNDTGRTSVVKFTPSNVSLEGCILRVKVTDHCNRKNFDTKIVGITGYHPPLGYFNVTHAGETFASSGNIDPLDTTHPANSLYTQISGKDFNVTLVALAADKVTLVNSDSTALLELIDTSGVTDLDPSSCEKAFSYATVGGYDFGGAKTLPAGPFSFDKARHEIGFRVDYYDFSTASTTKHYGIPDTETKSSIDNAFPQCSTACQTVPPSDWGCYECIAKTYGKSVCARDNFAVRPDHFSLGLKGTAPFVGGREYPIEINATTFNGNNDIWYSDQFVNGSVVHRLFNAPNDANITSNLIVPISCTSLTTNSPTLYTTPIAFVQGVGQADDLTPLSFAYPNVGNINIVAIESKWASVDMMKAYAGTIQEQYDCIPESTTNTPDAYGKIGCSIGGSISVRFIPSRFNNTLTITDHNTNGNFTYIASSTAAPGYGAKITVTHTAVLDDNTTTATNYTADCFSHDVTAQIALINDANMGWSTTQSRIWMYDVNNSTPLTKTIPAQFAYNIGQASFGNGSASIGLLFDFQRSYTNPDNPIQISNNDFNITSVIDTVDTVVTGSDFDRSGTPTQATFLYARAKATKDFYDNVTTSSKITPIMIQVYCDKWPTSTTNCPSVDLINGQTNEYQWWLSTGHSMNNNDGNISLVSSTNGTVTPSISINIGSNGIDNSVTVTSTSNTTPATVSIDFNTASTSDWVIYNKDTNSMPSPFYRVRFINLGGWTGYGKTGHVVEDDINNQKNQRLEQ